MTPDPTNDRRAKPWMARHWGWFLVFIALVTGAGFLGLRGEAATVTQDRGTYYRLKVKLAYKGEQQDFDIVVGCSCRRTTPAAAAPPTRWVWCRRCSGGA
jgi:hypothetical protein